MAQRSKPASTTQLAQYNRQLRSQATASRLLKRLLVNHFYPAYGSLVWNYRENTTLHSVDPKLNASIKRWAKQNGIELMKPDFAGDLRERVARAIWKQRPDVRP